MKICFVALFSYPLFQKGYDGQFGSAEIQLFNIGNELKRGEVKVAFIVGDSGQKTESSMMELH